VPLTAASTTSWQAEAEICVGPPRLASLQHTPDDSPSSQRPRSLDALSVNLGGAEASPPTRAERSGVRPGQLVRLARLAQPCPGQRFHKRAARCRCRGKFTRTQVHTLDRSSHYATTSPLFSSESHPPQPSPGGAPIEAAVAEADDAAWAALTVEGLNLPYFSPFDDAARRYHNRGQSELILRFVMHASDVNISSPAGGESDRAMAAAMPPIQIHTSPRGVLFTQHCPLPPFTTQHYAFPPFLPRAAYLVWLDLCLTCESTAKIAAGSQTPRAPTTCPCRTVREERRLAALFRRAPKVQRCYFADECWLVHSLLKHLYEIVYARAHTHSTHIVWNRCQGNERTTE
jgi:hypothetical protein